MSIVYCQQGWRSFLTKWIIVIAEKHEGQTNEENLAFTCWRCNRYKGTDLGSFDPQTAEFSLLFNPRTHAWTEHFRLKAFQIIGLTPEGRTTVNLLQLNSQERLAERERLSQATSQDMSDSK